MTAPSASAVAHAVDTVFRHRAYQRSAQQSLLSDILSWLVQAWGNLIDVAARTPGAGLVITWALYVIAAAIALRLGYAVVRHYWTTDAFRSVPVGPSDVGSLWNAAHAFADRGDYTAAAHALYGAMVRTLMLNGVLHTHPSKTAGDYLRELGHAHRPVLFNAFSQFVRAYEVVVYRDATCDAERYARLYALAEPIVQARREAA